MIPTPGQKVWIENGGGKYLPGTHAAVVRGEVRCQFGWWYVHIESMASSDNGPCAHQDMMQPRDDTSPRPYTADPLAEDWTEQPPIPDSWLGITGPLSDEQEKDLDAYCRYVRHTIDIDPQYARPAIPTHWIIPIPRWWLSVKAWFAKVSSFPEDQP